MARKGGDLDELDSGRYMLQMGPRAAYFKQAIHEKLIEHKEYIEKHGDDIPTISGWQWGKSGAGPKAGTSTEGDNV